MNVTSVDGPVTGLGIVQMIAVVAAIEVVGTQGAMIEGM